MNSLLQNSQKFTMPNPPFLLLSQGILLKWTKGFSAVGCVGKDAVQLLREAVKRQQVCVEAKEEALQRFG